jgi:predicted small lipoprotein YifL
MKVAQLLIILSVFLSGCGMKGDLYLPEKKDPNKNASLVKK